MTLLKIPFKIIAVPIALAVTVLQWFGIFLTSFAGSHLLYLLRPLLPDCDTRLSDGHLYRHRIGSDTGDRVCGLRPSLCRWVGDCNGRRTERKPLGLHQVLI